MNTKPAIGGEINKLHWSEKLVIHWLAPIGLSWIALGGLAQLGGV